MTQPAPTHDTFLRFMAKRATAIERGLLGKSPVARLANIAWLRQYRLDRLIKNARDYAAHGAGADPFAYAVAMSHYQSGTADLDDYGRDCRP